MKPHPMFWRYAYTTLVAQLAVYIFAIYADNCNLPGRNWLMPLLTLPYLPFGWLFDWLPPREPNDASMFFLTVGPLVGMTFYATILGLIAPRLFRTRHK